MRIRPVLAAVTLALAAAGCGGDDASSDEPADTTAITDTTDTTDVGLANPASAFCVEQGGTVEIVDEEGGQVGYCNLPDGTRVEEWEYFRANSSDAAADDGGEAVTEETTAP